MRQESIFQDRQGRVRKRWLWIGMLFLVLLIFSCLALISFYSRWGWGPEGMKSQYQLGNAFTDVPDCPPAMLCSVPRVDPRNIHWVLWMDVEKHTPTGVEMNRQKLLDISLPWYPSSTLFTQWYYYAFLERFSILSCVQLNNGLSNQTCNTFITFSN